MDAHDVADSGVPADDVDMPKPVGYPGRPPRRAEQAHRALGGAEGQDRPSGRVGSLVTSSAFGKLKENFFSGWLDKYAGMLYGLPKCFHRRGY
ncbi:hypothetical protein MLD38_037098 [Melastoma candidum]|uniref:Uncharacterized protein n=1 Tax=Melastoma candidum TaxID=119954 RepID=A0ACB9LL22_9MYRT|nr:hypothetical protein MLD38_037098 [Melastoma candidum]